VETSRSRQLTLAGSAVAFAGACAVAGFSASVKPGVVRISASSWVAELLLLSLALVGAWATRRPPERALGWVPGRLSGGAVVGLALATLGASHALDGVLTVLDLRDRSSLGVLADALRGIRGIELASALVALGLLPAIAEELLCRGLIQRRLLGHMRPALAIAGSSLIFALLHGDAIHALLAAPLGVHLGVIAWWSDSTRPAVVCHAVNNLGAVLLGVGSLELPGPASLHIAVGLALAAAGWLAALTLRRRA
jgi:membrane protease YdiL (CAAX protease family)